MRENKTETKILVILIPLQHGANGISYWVCGKSDLFLQTSFETYLARD